MSDIPDDVIEAARVLNMRLHSATELGQRTQWIAEALMAERKRSSQLLSEAETRETEARSKALEDAAKVADEMPKLLVSSPVHIEVTSPQDVAKRIRSLQSEER